MTELPDKTKDELMQVLSHAASQDRAVIEFHEEDGSLHAAEITEHVERLEEANE